MLAEEEKKSNGFVLFIFYFFFKFKRGVMLLFFVCKCWRVTYAHSFKTRLGSAGRTVNRWVGRFEPTFGSVMQLTRPEPVKIGKNQ